MESKTRKQLWSSVFYTKAKRATKRGLFLERFLTKCSPVKKKRRWSGFKANEADSVRKDGTL